MPLFMYSCGDCGEQSEILVRGAEEPACPKCGSKKLEKQASSFAAVVGNSRASETPPPCASGACASGGCPFN
jgi:putative FmdB family regulatory protein